MIKIPDESVHMTIVPSRQIAKYLLEIGAVKFNVDQPFIWASGIKSPIYCDNRIINSNIIVRNAVITEFRKIVSDNFLPATEIIAGVATGGMPYGVLLADRLELPFIYVRSERKEHGLKKAVEGDFKEGARVILIEDHISTGKSSMKAIEFLREEGLTLLCLLSITTYGFREAEEKFRDNDVKHGSICDFDTVLEVAEEQELLSSAQVETILQFRRSPKDWRK
jgi:orotate phosphoribosyltransferase